MNHKKRLTPEGQIVTDLRVKYKLKTVDIFPPGKGNLPSIYYRFEQGIVRLPAHMIQNVIDALSKAGATNEELAIANAAMRTRFGMTNTEGLSLVQIAQLWL